MRFHTLGVAIVTIILSIVKCQATEAEDVTRPYEFGFNIEGYQHRHEKKDEKGIIMGEFGFVTGDGIYHITVYATDEDGNFKIIKMKNKYIGLPNDKQLNAPEEGLLMPIKVTEMMTNQLEGKKPEGIAGCGGCIIPVKPESETSNEPMPGMEEMMKEKEPHHESIDSMMPIVMKPAEEPMMMDHEKPMMMEHEKPMMMEHEKPMMIEHEKPMMMGHEKPMIMHHEDPMMMHHEKPMMMHHEQPMMMHHEKPMMMHHEKPMMMHHEKPMMMHHEKPMMMHHEKPMMMHHGKPMEHHQALKKPMEPAPFMLTSPGADEEGVEPSTVSTPSEMAEVEGTESEMSSPVPTEEILPENPEEGGGLMMNMDSTESSEKKPTIPPAIVMQMINTMKEHGKHENHAKPPTKKPPQMISHDELLKILYKYNYTLPHHGHHEIGNKRGDKSGAYFSNGRDGIGVNVKYTANQFGFQPNITFRKLSESETPKKETEKILNKLHGYEFKWFYSR